MSRKKESIEELDEFINNVKSRAGIASDSDVPTGTDDNTDNDENEGDKEEVEMNTGYLSPLVRDNELFNVINEIGG